MELIDTHAHLTYKGLMESLAEVLQRSAHAGITKCIAIGTDAEHNEKVISITEKHPNLYAVLGIHPHHASEYKAADLQRLKELTKHEKVVALGETGLDFHYNLSKPDAQKDLFKTFLEIAAEKKLPIIIHTRDAFDETMEIIDKFADKNTKIVFHCWGGTVEQTQIVLEKGFYISFTGIVTFKNAEQARETAKIVPPGRMMIETDSPFMSPEPMRKQKINEPALLVHTAAKIAELKQMPLEIFAREVTKTTKQFFNLP
ncbi:MAG: TatD family hydrolase [Sedimentisphaerales bacterium]|jgi:TatD DNase family protein